MRMMRMTKVVINTCYGGFGLSEKGMREYAKRKGITLYVERKSYYNVYWTCPPEKCVGILSDAKWCNATLEERKKSNDAYEKCTLYEHDIPRDDPDLVAVVEELGNEASDKYADLRVVEIPDDVSWNIEEYDGKEWVSEIHRTWY
jgi:hypothetical protein